MGQLETGRWSKEYYFKVWRVMRLGSYNTIGRELLASSDMFLQNDGSHNLDMKPTRFEPSLKSEPFLDLTSRLSVAQQEGKAAVDLYRIWWEKYDQMTKGDKNVEEGWGRIKDGGSEMSTMSSTFFVYFAAILFTFSILMLMTILICKKCRTRRTSKLSTSTVSLPPPYEMVVEEKSGSRWQPAFRLTKRRALTAWTPWTPWARTPTLCAWTPQNLGDKESYRHSRRLLQLTESIGAYF